MNSLPTIHETYYDFSNNMNWLMLLRQRMTAHCQNQANHMMHSPANFISFCMSKQVSHTVNTRL
jgi:hypothetical protein